MITDTKPLSKRLRGDAEEIAGWGAGNEAATVREAADALDAQASLLREAAEFVRQFVQAATEDESIQNSPVFESDDIGWFVNRARSLLLKLTQATT